MRIDVSVEDPNLTLTDRNRRSHCQPRAPRTLLPRQIDPRHVRQRQTTQQGHAGVAFVMQIDWFFEIKPPLALHGFNAAGDSSGHMDPVHIQLRPQLARDVMTASANRSLVCLLQGEDVDGGQQFSAGESACGDGDEIFYVLRTAREIHEAQFAQHAAGN